MTAMTGMLIVLALQAPPAPATPAPPPHVQSQQPPAAEAPQRAAAYYQFLLARALEGEDKGEGAVKALEQAVALDPASAELRAELASMLLRLGRSDEARAAAEGALKVDGRNAEAHWVLGTMLATRALRPEASQSPNQEDLAAAAGHFEQALWDRRFDLGMQVTLGRLYLAKGDAQKAVDVLRSVVEREPGAVEAAWLLSQALDGAGKPREAVDTLRELLAVEPRFFRAWTSLAELYERSGRFSEAAEAYAQAAQQDARSSELRLRQAQALLSAGQAAAARDVMRGVVSASPTDATALYLLSTTEREAGDLEAAETAARRLVALDASDLRGPYALAQVLEERHDYAGIVATLVPAIERASQKPGPRTRLHMRVLAFLGFAYQERGDFTRAIATFEEARAAGDTSAEGYLAQAQLAAGETAAALATLDRARAARPQDLGLARVHAQALQRTGKNDEAASVMQDAVKYNPEQLESWLSLADAQASAGRVDDAMVTLDDAGRRFAKDARVPFQRGAIYEQKKRFGEAEAAFKSALALDPLHAASLNYLGYMLVEMGQRLDEATRMIERALEIDPGNPSYLDSLGWARFKRGEFEKAREPLQQAAERLPRNSVVQDHYGDLLAALGDKAGAISAWERAIAGDGELVDPVAIKKKIDGARLGRK